MINGSVDYPISPGFNWTSEYDQELEKLATSDYVETDWNQLRDMIKFKLSENIKSFMADPPPSSPPLSSLSSTIPFPSMSVPQQVAISTESPYSPRPLPTTPVRFPPFPRRAIDRNAYKSQGRQKVVLSEEEAKTIKESIYRLLHEFEGYPPFTIQRICELMIHPKKNFRYLGKYLRAVERTLLVTSTIDVFPVVNPEDSESTFSLAGSLREATTPLFSPIPFLHEDARRSHSRSPPISPLHLPTSSTNNPNVEPLSLGASASASAMKGAEENEGPVLGLVDELDDPSPGHLSERPTALSSTTSVGLEADSSSSEAPTASARISGKPMFGGSLGDRFVKASSRTESTEGTDAMAVDEPEPDADKENVKT